jgi:hypothetical protein
MPPSDDPYATNAGLVDSDVLELEPTAFLGAIPHTYGTEPHDFTRATRHTSPVAFVEGSMASLSGETHDLKRERLRSAGIAGAAIFGLVMIWVFESNNPGTLAVDGSPYSIRLMLIALRCLLAAGVAGLLSSDAPLSKGQLRVIENVLFLGLTVLMMVSQYVVGLDLIHRGPEYVPILLAFIKDGVIQMLALMMIYGTLIPNPPRVAAKTLLAMFAGPVLTMILMKLHPDTAEVITRLATAEEAGSNILFLGIAAVLAFYGSYVLNGLRVELHDARKFGQYRLLNKIGAGGMGEVYKAEHQLLKRPCALKLIKPESGANPTALARFEREVHAAARLSHPNTIAIYDYGHSEDGTFYYVMEYLPGMSLEDLVRQTGPLPPARVIYLLRQACAGLAEAHAIGLVHRDLKPANIFIAHRGGETDVAKVLDFGLVKLTQDPEAPTLTADMTVSGTPSYMAPEQATGRRDLDVRADVYAMGAVIYFALTGQPPFSGESAFAIMMAHARDQAVPPSQLQPGIPADLEAIVLKALEKKPEDRYPDARAMGRALAACEAASEWDADHADRWWAEAGSALEVE